MTAVRVTGLLRRIVAVISGIIITRIEVIIITVIIIIVAMIIWVLRNRAIWFAVRFIIIEELWPVRGTIIYVRTVSRGVDDIIVGSRTSPPDSHRGIIFEGCKGTKLSAIFIICEHCIIK